MAAKKKVWLTWMPGGEGAAEAAAAAGAALQKVGLAVGAAVWNPDVDKHAWTELGGTLAEPGGADVWIVAGARSDLELPANRYALSLVSAMVRELRGHTLPLVLVGLDHAPAADALPTFLDPIKCIDASSASSWAAKALVAIHGAKPEKVVDPFRFTCLAHEYFGQWFELGPRQGDWDGVLFGIAGDDAHLQEHAVGEAGDLPERTRLEYAMHGIKAEVGGTEYTACAVKNRIDGGHSYWVQVKGRPTKLIFGAHPDAEEQEAWVVDLV